MREILEELWGPSKALNREDLLDSYRDLVSACEEKVNMPLDETVSEGRVLIATMKYLMTRKVLPYQVSVAQGKGIDAKSIKAQIKDWYDTRHFYSLLVMGQTWWRSQKMNGGL